MTTSERLSRRSLRFANEHQPIKLTAKMSLQDRAVIVDYLAFAWKRGYQTARRDKRRADNG